MRFVPQTRIGWASLTLLPFKTYVAAAFPIACLLPDVDGRHGWNHSLMVVLPGYAVCFLFLLVGGFVQRACHRQREGIVSLIYAAASLFVFFGPWFSM